MKTLLVTGTDTNVGKTWVTCLLIRQFQQHGYATGAYKPVCSGAEISVAGDLRWSDVECLRDACGFAGPDNLICPQRFRAPVAPNKAAEMEGKEVHDSLLLDGMSAWKDSVEWLIVEGAGGVFCPLSNRSTVMDLALKLQGPVVVAAANRLGVISHTRLTVDAIKSRGLHVVAIVLNETSEPTSGDLDPSQISNAEQLMHWIPDVPLFHCAWQGQSLTPLTGKTGAACETPCSIVDLVN